MVTKLASIFGMIATILRTYPALSAALVNIGVVCLAHFGLHVTSGQLVADVAILNVLFGVIVHSNVTPTIKTKGQ